MSSILSRCRLSISKRGYHSRTPTAIKRVMFYSSLQAAVSNSIYSNINFKVKQVVCLEAIYRGRDVVAVLPTGYGKSMIFHLLPSLFLDKIKGAFHYMIPTGQRPADRPLNNGMTFSDRSDLLPILPRGSFLRPSWRTCVLCCSVKVLRNLKSSECKQCTKNLYLETSKIVNML